MEIFLWITCAILVGMWADRWDRSGWAFGLISFIATPIVGAFALLAYGKGEAKDPATGLPMAWKFTKCPHCAEKILREAKVCKHCHRQIED